MGKNVEEKKHRQRVKKRRFIGVSKPKKNKHIKYILISFLSLVSVLILFRIFFVKKIEMSTVITVQNIIKVSEGGSNTYYRYGRGKHTFELKYPAVYKIKAISETGEQIIFETTEPNQYWYNGKFAIKYTSYKKIFNKTSIKSVERLSYY